MTSQASASETQLPITSSDDLEQLAQRVDGAIAEIQSLAPDVRAKALALKSAIEAFHKVGLTQIVRKLKDDPAGKQLLFDLLDEPAVYALFTMHGLVRADPKTRVARVLEMVRPYMQSHGGDVTLVDLQDKTVYVRLAGNCNGCSMSSATLRNIVEESLREHVPEVERVEVVPNEPENLVQLQTPSAGNEESWGWIEGPLTSELQYERPYAFEDGGHKILLIQSKQGVRAYRNACAHQGLPLDGGLVDFESGTITCPWHGFQYDSESGECLSAPQCQLESFPLRIENERILVRPE
jgi:Fe-S cluster biogenesis protein NfuA/nitrite reductase/ring-hydroxylating ferredoxin subunit